MKCIFRHTWKYFIENNLQKRRCEYCNKAQFRVIFERLDYWENE